MSFIKKFSQITKKSLTAVGIAAGVTGVVLGSFAPQAEAQKIILIPIENPNSAEDYITFTPAKADALTYSTEAVPGQGLRINVQNVPDVQEGASCDISVRAVPVVHNVSENFIDINGFNSTYTNGKCAEGVLPIANQVTAVWDVRIRIKNPSTGLNANFEFGADVNYFFNFGATGATDIQGVKVN